MLLKSLMAQRTRTDGDSHGLTHVWRRFPRHVAEIYARRLWV